MLDKIKYPPDDTIMDPPDEKLNETYSLMATCKNCGYKHIAEFNKGTGPYEVKKPENVARVSKDQHPSQMKPVCVDWPCPNCFVVGVTQFSPNTDEVNKLEIMHKQLQESNKRRDLFENRAGDLVKELNEAHQEITILRNELAKHNIPMPEVTHANPAADGKKPA